jgi:hypothetical protein
VSALRTCPGCGRRRILLERRGGGVRLCIDCRALPYQAPLFDADKHTEAAA